MKALLVERNFSSGTRKHVHMDFISNYISCLLTDNVQIPDLWLHGVSVDLQHAETAKWTIDFDSSNSRSPYLTHVPKTMRTYSVIMHINANCSPYHPRSLSRMSLSLNCHVLFSVKLIPTRWFLVITLFWIVKIVCVSTRSQATLVGKGKRGSQ